MIVRYTETARSEISEILSYLEEHSPGAASVVAGAMQEAIRLIARHPHIAPVVHGADLRSKKVGRFQYRVYYSVHDNEIVIRNVRNTRRRFPWEDTD